MNICLDLTNESLFSEQNSNIFVELTGPSFVPIELWNYFVFIAWSHWPMHTQTPHVTMTACCHALNLATSPPPTPQAHASKLGLSSFAKTFKRFIILSFGWFSENASARALDWRVNPIIMCVRVVLWFRFFFLLLLFFFPHSILFSSRFLFLVRCWVCVLFLLLLSFTAYFLFDLRIRLQPLWPSIKSHCTSFR